MHTFAQCALVVGLFIGIASLVRCATMIAAIYDLLSDYTDEHETKEFEA